MADIKFAAYIVPPIALIIIYAVVGLLAVSTGVNVYDNTPLGNFTLKQGVGKDLSFGIKNSAWLTLPFVTPTFYGQVTVDNPNVTCTVATPRGRQDCNEIQGDWGYIESGQSTTQEFRIVPVQQDFSFEEQVFIGVLIPWKVASKRIECQFDGYNDYSRVPVYSCT